MVLLKKKTAYVPKTGLLEDATDYAVYHIPLFETVIVMIAAAMAGGMVGWIFYESVILTGITAILCAAGSPSIWRNYRIRKRREKLLLEFREMLESLTTSLGAGSNTQYAFQSALSDMLMRFGEKSLIVRELDILNNGIANNLREEDLLLNWGERSGLKDIISFANVFETCNRKGGDICEIIKSTRNILNDKIEIAEDIKTAVTGEKTEQNAMLVMPVVCVFLLKNMGSEIIDLSSTSGRVSTTIALVLFVAAYFISKKIMDIKV